MSKLLLLSFFLSIFSFSCVSADENRYQAHWNGKYYLIIDSDKGHMWNLRNDSLIYNGQIEADNFTPPEDAQIWQRKHGKWQINN